MPFSRNHIGTVPGAECPHDVNVDRSPDVLHRPVHHQEVAAAGVFGLEAGRASVLGVDRVLTDGDGHGRYGRLGVPATASQRRVVDDFRTGHHADPTAPDEAVMPF